MNRLRELTRVGHWRSLLAALLHFEVSFAVWVLLGVLAPFVVEDLDLSPGLAGLVIAIPLLAGAVWRVILGWLADGYGPKRIGTISMALVLLPLTWGWLAATTLGEVLAIGVLLGLAGASFAVSLPLASSHYPASHQGLALGVAGAGNSGTILAGLLAPRIAEEIGWHATFAVAMIPVALAVVGWRLLAKEPPLQRPRKRLKDMLEPLRASDCWRLCGLYAVTFGGYVGLASYLPSLLVDRYGVSAVAAGTITAAAAGAGSMLRPFGGGLSDRWGGTRVLPKVFLLAGTLAAMLGAVTGLAPGIALSIALLATLGAGNGAVFQLVPLRFPATLGVVTGVIGAAGGLGGFLLPTVLGFLRQATGSYWLGLTLYSAVALIAMASTFSIRVRWRTRAPSELAAEQAAI